MKATDLDIMRAIEEERLRQKISRAELERQAQVASGQLSKHINYGVHPELWTAIRFADALGFEIVMRRKGF